MLGDFLNFLAKRRRRLDIRILTWDYPVLFSKGRELLADLWTGMEAASAREAALRRPLSGGRVPASEARRHRRRASLLRRPRSHAQPVGYE